MDARCFDDCVNGLADESTRAFRVVLDGTPTLEALDPPSCVPSTYGRAVNADGTLAGANNRDRLEGNSLCNEGGECTNDREATVWTAPDTPDPISDGTPRGSEVRAMNGAGEMAGYRLRPEFSNCRIQPVFWTTSTTFDLLERPTDSDDIWAEGLNDSEPPQVVGANITSGVALLWDTGKGEVTALRDISGPDTDLRRAHDINASSWIVASGVEPGVVDHIYVLVPINRECPYDLNADGEVSFADILLILSRWGACPVGEICSADATMDGTIDFADILAVLAAWGPCPGNSEPASRQEVIEGAGLTWPDDWDEFLGIMETGTQLQKDNYSCWIDHYFNAHYAMTCLCAPSCTGADPYGNHP